MQARQFVKKELPVLLDGLALLDATELISKIDNKIQNKMLDLLKWICIVF